MMSNSQLKSEVMQELLFESAVNSSGIHVAANNGVVRLTGRVANHLEKWAAEQATQRVEGVKAIIQEIEVIPTGLRNLKDSKIVQAAVSSLRT